MSEQEVVEAGMERLDVCLYYLFQAGKVLLVLNGINFACQLLGAMP